MKIGLVGLGAIGTFLVQQCPKHEWVVYDAENEKARQTLKRNHFKNARLVDSFSELLFQKPELVVEAASQAAVPLLEEALKTADVIVMSVGALMDDGLYARLKSAASRHSHRLLIPSGAVGGLDVLQACGPREVLLQTRKSPKSLGRTDAQEAMVFDGTAREACRKFPKNVNVAATLALAGIGFDATHVQVMSDPSATQNTHTVIVRGDSGEYVFTFANVPFSGNPATSELAARSAVHAIRKRDAAIQIG